MSKILLITPPFTQLNTPYPATAYLKGFLNTKQISSSQMDLGLEVLLNILSGTGLTQLFAFAEENSMQLELSENAKRIFLLKNNYIHTIDNVISFLQGKNQTLARQICTQRFLPQASRFAQENDLDWAFGNMGLQDKAKHIATLYLEDLSDFIIECIDENFGFSRYAERLGRSANSFDELHENLNKRASYIDKITLKILDFKLKALKPELICFSVPFPGNLYSAFRCAQFIKLAHPQIKIIMGGGFANTELRSLKDPRVFNYFDFITLDDGELPLEQLLGFIKNDEPSDTNALKRTYLLQNNEVHYFDNSYLRDYKQNEVGTPDYSDLLLDKYISVIEVTNPMHSLWSDGRWNKLTMTHGCYWGKCTFCDGSLPYIKDFDPLTAKILADRMEQIVEQTGERGFHFVDEAAHPSLMKSLALEIIRRKLVVTWWTNIRFEKSFSYDVCQLLKASGCIAVSGGLEVASDRLLGLINKGVTVEQVAKVTSNFTKAGIMVHAYLMYGFPSQTIQETIDSLEMVRQMFELQIIQSGFWHQFALTAHSPIGLMPERYGIKPNYKEITFANNDIDFTDSTGISHSKFSYGLKKSIFNFMNDIGFDFPLQEWFEFKIPKTKIPKNYIASALSKPDNLNFNSSNKVHWIGNLPEYEIVKKTKKGKTWSNMQLHFHSPTDVINITIDHNKGEWLVGKLKELSPNNKKTITLNELKDDFEKDFDDFELFWYSKPLLKLRNHGLVCI